MNSNNKKNASKYNIVYMHSHDTGRYIEPYGYAINTPNLQKLAEEGVTFRSAHCVSPSCSPSRASFLTGQWAHCNGMLGLAHRGFRLHDYRQMLSHVLARNGYETVLAGTQHVAAEPFASLSKLRYQRILTNENDDQLRAQNAAAYLSESHTQPFFLDVGFTRTHRRWFSHTQTHNVGFVDPQDKLPNPNYVRPPATMVDTAQTRVDMAEFIASANQLDSFMGQILDALQEADLSQNTLVICTTDHGIAFPGMKCTLTDHGTGVMLLMRGPKGFEGGKVINGLISQIDIFPTICEVLDISKPDWLQGQSIMPLITGQKEEIHDAIFTELSYHAAYEPQRAVRTRRYNYIRRFGNYPGPVMPNIANGLSKTYWIENNYEDHILPQEVLFDLVFDPNEAHNLADDPAYQNVLEEMRHRLDTWMDETSDPLLNGDVPLPMEDKIQEVDKYGPNNTTV